MSGKQSDSPQGLGWIGGVAMFLVFVVLRLLFRRFAQPAFRAGLDIDNWQLIELLAVIVFGLSFAVWFAVTKFRHRRTLGRMASVTGWTEIVILLIHAGLAVTIFAVLINEAAANPLLDDDGVDQLLEPWIKRASLVSSVSHALWCVLTAMFFASTRGRVCQLPEWSRRCLEAD